MKIIIGSEHAGFSLKERIIKKLIENEHELLDLGYQSEKPQDIDYTNIASRVSEAIVNEKNALGILICGTGIGMSIVANKFPGIRAALCTNEFSAVMAREHNNSNILCLGSWNVGERLANRIVDSFLVSQFTKGRHIPRVNNIEKIERNMIEIWGSKT